MPTPPNGNGYKAKGHATRTASFINDTVRSYRKNRAAFMVSRLWVKG
ncbi:MAG: hypothetical protein F6J98_15110 [Moorea sp. SIO4G2]|nr:hypothetical protein [Moorena sp. SIO4G2]